MAKGKKHRYSEWWAQSIRSTLEHHQEALRDDSPRGVEFREAVDRAFFELIEREDGVLRVQAVTMFFFCGMKIDDVCRCLQLNMRGVQVINAEFVRAVGHKMGY